ncbi:Hypothetical protein (plasmid) [Pseudomonas putida]|jgi:hypothetical protein|uniref:Uncharacterized protein n=1 Tax=Pseudomonas putida TaxID=303 RepID=A0A1X1A1C0_PSEPU|nr:hypothetical protein [Pseudomonas sp.]ORL52205.1 hypothetical protein B7H18_09325 [Pseudomonas putida]PLP92200.1 hypothetical protein CX682_09645 [Pseudomonas sp. FFUP_PS_41]ORL58700.1 hypothetical protein B7H17_24525 [Pseudomonas putida]ORL65580.1 hypothetical protein B7H19_22795 [Pseudomonas putida]QDQ70690.1 hypothetical protein pJBCL41_00083 [Pseudomonas sp.]
MHRTTTLLLAAATSAATSKLLAKTLGGSESVARATAQMAKRDLQALEAHVYATGVDLCDHPLFRLAHGVPRDNHNTAVLPA